MSGLEAFPMTPEECRSALLAGRVVMAVAEDDQSAAQSALDEATQVPGGVLNLLADVAGISVTTAQILAGENWRTQLGMWLNALELEAGVERG